MRRCDDRPPLLEELFAQTLSGKNMVSLLHCSSVVTFYACLATLPPRLSFQWESLAPMGTARACAVAEALGGELYVTWTLWTHYFKSFAWSRES